MITIQKKYQCCGCSACVQKCPKSCISLEEDSEGFLYPKVDKSNCIDCGLCEKVCIERNPFPEKYPLSAYACKNKDEKIRKQSSSGGVFYSLAEQILKNNGIVFGVKFNEDWECEHTYIESVEQIEPLLGSKYLPSKLGYSFKQIEGFLKAERDVLFVGTSCQVAALNKYLDRSYKNLFTVELVCHGVPSPAVWRNFLKEEINTAFHSQLLKKVPFLSSQNTMSLIKDIKFREKKLGWKKFRFVLNLAEPSCKDKKSSVLSSIHTDNNFMRLFINDVILRPSCYHCPAKKGKTNSDLTIADFWGIENILPDFDDDRGVSLVYVNSDKGKYLLDSIKLEKRSISVTDATKTKTAWLNDNRKEHPLKKLFYIAYKFLPIRTCIAIGGNHSILYRGQHLFIKLYRKLSKICKKV